MRRVTIAAQAAAAAPHGEERYRPEIDGLRAVAVLAVMAFHLDPGWVPGGFVGVDIFFVISGYLITRLIEARLAAGRFSFGDFYLRRARRLFPSLFVTLTATFVTGVLVLTPEHLAQQGGAMLYALLALSNVFFWREAGYFDLYAEVKPLLHTWSLSVEEQFYLLWPALLVWLARSPRRAWPPLLLTVAGIASVLGVELLRARDAEAVFYLTPFRIAEFACGAVLVWLPRWPERARAAREALCLVGLALAVLPLFFYSRATPFPGVPALLPCLGSALVIHAGGARAAARLLGNRLAVGVGRISYSLYLVHWPLFVYYRYIKFAPLSPWELAGLPLAALALAALMYRYIEQPYRYARVERGAWSAPAFGLGCALLALLLILPAASTWAQLGWPGRLDAVSQRALRAMRQAWGNECVASSAELRCDFTPPQSARRRKLYLLGDSHAAHFRAGLAWLLRDSDFVALDIGRHSCLPVPNSYWISDDRQRSDDECRRMNEHLLERVADADVVVLAGRWAVYTSTHAFGPDPFTRFAQVRAGHEVYDPAYSMAVVSRGLEDFVAQLIARGIKVVVFGQVPNQGFDLAQCLGRGVFARHLAEHACAGRPYAEIKGRVAPFDAVLRRLGEAHPAERLQVLLPSSVLCNDRRQRCSRFIGGTFLYRDFNHLNAPGSIALMARFRARLAPFLGLPAPRADG